jgi:acylphosphatase
MAMHLRITGRVQGVGYRAGFAAEAHRLKLAGWVRNRLDGSVEALVEGSAAALDEIVEWSRHGPGLSKVEQVHITEQNDPATLLADQLAVAFEIRPTE